MNIKNLVVVTILFFSILLIPNTNAAGAISGGESGGSNCEDYYHQGILAIGGIDGGDVEVWSKIPGCGKAHSSTEALAYTSRASGPVIAATSTSSYNWQFNDMSGCTSSLSTVLADPGLAGSGATFYSRITMTSTECRFAVIFTLTVLVTLTQAVIYQTRQYFAVDIQVEQPNYSFLCDSTHKTANAYNPNTDICNLSSSLNFNCQAPEGSSLGLTYPECNSQKIEPQTFTTNKGTLFSGPPSSIKIPYFSGSAIWNYKPIFQVTYPSGMSVTNFQATYVADTCNNLPTGTGSISSSPVVDDGDNRVTNVFSTIQEVLTTNDNFCSIVWSIGLTLAGGAYYDNHYFITNFEKDPVQQVQNYGCAAATVPSNINCLTPQVNNFNFLCGATNNAPSTFNSATTVCTTPALIHLEHTESCAIPLYIDSTVNSLFTASGPLALCVDYRQVVQPSSTFVIRAEARFPTMNSGTTSNNLLFSPRTSIVPANFGGCTFNNVLNSPTTTSSGTISDEEGDYSVTMTGDSCDGYVHIDFFLIATPTITRLTLSVPFSIKTTTVSTSNTGVQHLVIDSWPTLISTVTNSGTLTLSGSINVANSGTQHIIVDTWPSLTAAVTNSGTINVVNSGGQTMTITGSVSVSGGLTVTNAGGQSITVTSWPQLQAVLSGNLNIHQDQACGTTTHCELNVHQDQACGATITCKSSANITAIVTGNTTVNQNNNLNVQLSLLPYYLLLIAVAFFAVFADMRADGLYWFIDLILSIYLLIIRPENSVIPRAIFLGWIFVVAYQAIALLSNKRATNLTGDSEA